MVFMNSLRSVPSAYPCRPDYEFCYFCIAKFYKLNIGMLAYPDKFESYAPD
jgi:hypothetical protein